MEAVRRLTGWPLPPHLTAPHPRPVTYLPPLERDPEGEWALRCLAGGMSLPDYLLSRAGPQPPAALLRQLDRTDLLLYDTTSLLPPAATARPHAAPGAAPQLPQQQQWQQPPSSSLPVNPQEREAARQRPLSRPHMKGSRVARKRLREEVRRREAEAAGEVPW
ncbi:hypothetical protein Agub_g1754 [Astrephomene gubernaculifera]|uniref:Uncharacterized protein n=1 Tax=Astrephomene gubernaculifera TaxID=47775 RepID=A0AAD3DIN8_9CHLO|nr:hypothetical protein Agub_g1754 [Astrephomene gubernaculifera]